MARKPALHADEIAAIHRGIERTWQYIGDDTLVDDNGNPSNKTISKSEVLELCLDADRLEQHGGPGWPGKADSDWSRGAWRALCAKFYDLPPTTLNRIARGFSPYNRFGR